MRQVIWIAVVSIVLTSTAPAQTPPPGYRFVEITDGDGYYRRPKLNNQGQIVYSRADDGPDHTSQIFLYDNGQTIQITFDERVENRNPDINEDGLIIWNRANGPADPYGPTTEIMLYQDGLTWQLTDNDFDEHGARLNNLGHAAWTGSMPPCDDAGVADIFFYDGDSIRRITDGVSNNQGPKLNDLDQIIWTRHDTRCSGSDLGQAVMLYSDGDIIQVSPEGADNPYAGSINSHGQVAWSQDIGPCQWETLVWENGNNSLLIELGGRAIINDTFVVSFDRFFHEYQSYQAYLYRNGEILQVSDNYNVMWNFIYDVNDKGEFILLTGDYGDTDLLFAKRLRLGDLNCDGSVDAFDIEPFVIAMFDPESFASTNCDLTLADLNGDGRVDAFDIEPFLEALFD